MAVRKTTAKPTTKAAAKRTTTKASTSTKTAPATRKPTAGKATAKKTTAKKTAPAVAHPTSVAEKRSWRNDASINKKTGFTSGTTSDKIALALLKGGESRKDIIASMDDLPTTTRNGTAFVASSVVGQVERQMLAMGFRKSSSYKLLPPARAAK